VVKSAYVKVSSPANIGGVMTECQVTVKSYPESTKQLLKTMNIIFLSEFQIFPEFFYCEFTIISNEVTDNLDSLCSAQTQTRFISLPA